MDDRMRECTIYTRQEEEVAVNEVMDRAEAFASAAGIPVKEMLILAYTPDFCGFVNRSGDNISAVGSGREISGIFELRCFCEYFELRWVHSGDGKGRMSAISDKNLDGFERQDDVFEITTASHYLLWGKGLSDAADDLCLFEHRVGGFYVPIPGKKGSRVALDFVEYFKPDEYKNMRWYTERLIGLRVI